MDSLPKWLANPVIISTTAGEKITTAEDEKLFESLGKNVIKQNYIY